jgi:hypothetical protein
MGLENIYLSAKMCTENPQRLSALYCVLGTSTENCHLESRIYLLMGTRDCGPPDACVLNDTRESV